MKPITRVVLMESVLPDWTNNFQVSHEAKIVEFLTGRTEDEEAVPRIKRILNQHAERLAKNGIRAELHLLPNNHFSVKLACELANEKAADKISEARRFWRLPMREVK